jgi:uncharacterized membrane protein YkvA (DUF1232 family)
MRFVLGVLITVALLWGAFMGALLIVRPRGMNLREARQVVPDTVRLLRALHADSELPPGVRRWLAALLVYLAMPIDLVPDFVPVLGYADDVIVVACVLRRVVRLAGPAALDRHWAGSPAGLAAIRRLAGVTE